MDRYNGAALGSFIASGVLAAAATTILVFHWPSDAGSTTASVSVRTQQHGAGLLYSLQF
jgi:hypothetical protein